MVRTRGCAASLLAVTLATAGACSYPPPTVQRAPTTSAVTVQWPGFDYESAARAGKSVFRLSTEESRIVVLARPDGPLAKFGHDHAIDATDAQGYLLLADDPSESRGALRFSATALRIDDARTRSDYGLGEPPEEGAIEGTRDNLLRHVLQPEDWPYIEIEMDDFRIEDAGMSARVEFRVNGTTHRVRELFRMHQAAGTVSVVGAFSILQTDLGLTPFAALGGGLRVADRLEIHFDLAGRALPARLDSSEQVLDGRPLFPQLGVRGIHAFAAEVVDLEVLDDTIVAALADAGVGVDHTWLDTVTAVGGHGHGNPVPVRRAQRPTADVVDGGRGGRGCTRSATRLDDRGATLLHGRNEGIPVPILLGATGNRLAVDLGKPDVRVLRRGVVAPDHHL